MKSLKKDLKLIFTKKYFIIAVISLIFIILRNFISYYNGWTEAIYIFRTTTFGNILDNIMNGEYFQLLFPILSTAIVGPVFVNEYKNGFLKNVLQRQTKKKYIINKYLSTAIGASVFIIAIHIFLFLTFYVVFILKGRNIDFTLEIDRIDSIKNYVAYGFSVEYSILLFFFFYIMNLCLCSITLNFIGLTMSLFVKKAFIQTVFPFFLFVTLSVLFGASKPQFAPQNMVDIFSNQRVSWYHVVFSCLSVIVICFITGYNYFVNKEQAID